MAGRRRRTEEGASGDGREWRRGGAHARCSLGRAAGERRGGARGVAAKGGGGVVERRGVEEAAASWRRGGEASIGVVEEAVVLPREWGRKAKVATTSL